MGSFITFFLAFRLRKSLIAGEPDFNKWDKIFVQVMIASGALFVINASVEGKILVQLLGYSLMFGMLWLILKNPLFKSERTILFSLAPVGVIYFISDVSAAVLSAFYDRYTDYFKWAEAIGWIWLLSNYIMYRRQLKVLKAEQEIRKKESIENRINAARKAELEVLVNLRTAELSGQNDKLKLALDELSAAQAQLVHSEKMASLGELTAGIAHEIQNPLNFVNNFSELNAELATELLTALDTDNLNEAKNLAIDIRENQEKVVHHGKRADSIVKSMLQHSRGSGSSRESIDLNALAEECIRLSYHGMKAKEKSFNAKMETIFDEGVGLIEVVSGEISRVLLNICTNAFYAVLQRGKLKEPEYQPTVWMTTMAKKGSVCISIRDNGMGIPDEVKDRIFQPFFTTKPTGEGTGLGLSMSYDIITKGHSGQISVSSKEGEGATFLIELPLKQAAENN